MDKDKTKILNTKNLVVKTIEKTKKYRARYLNHSAATGTN